MILKYFQKLLHLTTGQKEEREAENKLEAELRFLRRLSAKAKSSSNYGSYSKPYKEIPGEYLSTQ